MLMVHAAAISRKAKGRLRRLNMFTDSPDAALCNMRLPCMWSTTKIDCVVIKQICRLILKLYSGGGYHRGRDELCHQKGQKAQMKIKEDPNRSD